MAIQNVFDGPEKVLYDFHENVKDEDGRDADVKILDKDINIVHNKDKDDEKNIDKGFHEEISGFILIVLILILNMYKVCKVVNENFVEI